jgi:hypothetical protein
MAFDLNIKNNLTTSTHFKTIKSFPSPSSLSPAFAPQGGASRRQARGERRVRVGAMNKWRTNGLKNLRNSDKLGVKRREKGDD